jgi:hypothetical protein
MQLTLLTIVLASLVGQSLSGKSPFFLTHHPLTNLLTSIQSEHQHHNQAVSNLERHVPTGREPAINSAVAQFLSHQTRIVFKEETQNASLMKRLLMLRVRRLDLLGICGGRRKSIGGLNE